MIGPELHGMGVGDAVDSYARSAFGDAEGVAQGGDRAHRFGLGKKAGGDGDDEGVGVAGIFAFEAHLFGGISDDVDPGCRGGFEAFHPFNQDRQFLRRPRFISGAQNSAVAQGFVAAQSQAAERGEEEAAIGQKIADGEDLCEGRITRQDLIWRGAERDESRQLFRPDTRTGEIRPELPAGEVGKGDFHGYIWHWPMMTEFTALWGFALSARERIHIDFREGHFSKFRKESGFWWHWGSQWRQW